MDFFLLCRNGTKLGKGFDTCYVNVKKKSWMKLKKVTLVEIGHIGTNVKRISSSGNAQTKSY